MLKINDIVEYTESRITNQIEAAKKTAKSDEQPRVARRKNDAYFNILVRASLSITQGKEIDAHLQSLCVAVPELFFKGMFKLGYGDTRDSMKNMKGEKTKCPDLLCKYSNEFDQDSILKDSVKMIETIKEGKTNRILLCHGLSACDDTILLLADIGRSKRISYALEMQNFEIMLADISWIKHNRSLNRLYKAPEEFIKDLRICLDKRKRIYKALGLNYTCYGISERTNSEHNISRKTLINRTAKWRELAGAIWGESVLGTHNIEMKRIIGMSFDKINIARQIDLFSKVFLSIISVNNEIPKKLEEALKSELSALRTISELFSTFDKDIFLYYFAQYFAQSRYSNYLKIANISEKKFDLPFLQKNSEFSALFGDIQPATDDNNAYQLYLPWYRLGEYKLLPYTSTSGDVLKKHSDLSEIRLFLDKTILLDDYSPDKFDKILGIIKATPIEHRNRLASDILSFIRLLTKVDLSKELKVSINELSDEIGSQINSGEDDSVSTKGIYSEWLQSISKSDSVIPFHLIPYLWEDSDWNEERLQAFTKVLLNTLSLVHEICE